MKIPRVKIYSKSFPLLKLQFHSSTGRKPGLGVLKSAWANGDLNSWGTQNQSQSSSVIHIRVPPFRSSVYPMSCQRQHLNESQDEQNALSSILNDYTSLQILQRSQHEVMALQAESRTLEAEKRQLMVRRKRLFNEFTMGLKVSCFKFPAKKMCSIKTDHPPLGLWRPARGQEAETHGAEEHRQEEGTAPAAADASYQVKGERE